MPLLETLGLRMRDSVIQIADVALRVVMVLTDPFKAPEYQPTHPNISKQLSTCKYIYV